MYWYSVSQVLNLFPLPQFVIFVDDDELFASLLFLNVFSYFIAYLKEMNKFHTILLDQASRTVLKNLNVFVKDDINQVKDYKGHFLKVSEGYDNALIKNAQVSA